MVFLRALLPALLFACTPSPQGPPSNEPPASSEAARAASPGEPSPGAPYNVLLLVGDTVRADRMSLYGHRRPTTPRIDAFAASGRVYERALSPGIWTLPAHASLFTGLDVSAHGVVRVNSRLSELEMTLAEVFAEAGYETWAFTANPFVSEKNGLTQGFDFVETAWGERWSEQVALVMRERLRENDVNAKRVRLQLAVGHAMGFQAAGPVAQRAFIEWLESRPEPRPFFAFINYMEAHTPRIPSEASRRRLLAPGLSEHADSVDQTVDANVGWMAGAHAYSPKDFEALRAVYDASVADWDAAVGDLLDDLDARGILDHTLVIITADHGEALGEHRRIGHQFNVHGEVARVPLVMVAPGRIDPARVGEPISTREIFRHAIELSGVQAPPAIESRFEQGLRGQGVLTEFTAWHPLEMQMLRHFQAKNLDEFKRKLFAIEQGPHRYIHASDGYRGLFELTEDPGEENNVVADLPGIAGQLDALLAVRRAQEETPRVAPTVRFDEADRARLRALGYLE